MRLQVGRPIAAKDTEGFAAKRCPPSSLRFRSCPFLELLEPACDNLTAAEVVMARGDRVSNRDATFDLLPAAA